MSNSSGYSGSMQQVELASFMSLSSDGIVIVDTDGKVLELNRAFEMLHGWSREELIGRLLPVTPPHLIEEGWKLYLKAMSGSQVNGVETLKQRKDGSMFHASVTISPVQNAEGQIVALIAVERDITQQKLMERKLAESEERYRQLVEYSPEPLLALDDFEVYYANQAAVRLLGSQHAGQLTGRCFLDFIGSEHPIDMAVSIEQLLANDSPSDTMTMKLVCLDQSLIEVEVRVIPIVSRSNSSVQLLLRDITGRPKAASLQETEQLYECLVENAMTGVCLYQEEKMVYANPYFAAMFGYTGEEALQATLGTFIWEEDYENIREIAAQTLEGRLSTFPFSVKGVKKDGTLIYLEGLLTATTFRGKPSLLGTFQDVTYKFKVEEALRESAQRYQRLIKFLPEPIVVSDEGVLIYVNKSAMKLLRAKSEAELIGKSLLHFIHPDHGRTARALLQRALRKDEPSQFRELPILCCDGQLIDAELSSIRIHHYMGKTVVLTVLRDLTDRKRAEDILVRSEKLSILGQLAASLAHEIRNPLTSLKGFTQLLKSKAKEDVFYYDTMLTELERINLIVGDFMTLAKPQLAQFEYGSINRMLEHVVSVLNHQAVMMNVSIVSKVNKKLPDVYCDENQLKQVFINLIKNAIEAMPSGGNVVITAEQNGEHVSIKIKDQGEGISDSIVEKLGEPFLTTKSNGTGLGLMISYRIMEQHGGSLTIRSELHKGTTIELRLPIDGKRVKRPPVSQLL
ncbi:PAS domain S-box protein [Paenibacillus ginsengarvi]|uniref:histidine kinase n=2 Tax=Paenibacillus ginsengarvi TaxID=400777 RepID=A0A3B0C3U2_9BACL|nr:PAS domain S-box protein [Paenibacillus ginsengarvi]